LKTYVRMICLPSGVNYDWISAIQLVSYWN